MTSYPGYAFITLNVTLLVTNASLLNLMCFLLDFLPFKYMNVAFECYAFCDTSNKSINDIGIITSMLGISCLYVFLLVGKLLLLYDEHIF